MIKFGQFQSSRKLRSLLVDDWYKALTRHSILQFPKYIGLNLCRFLWN